MLLTTWLIELFLNELGALQDRGEQREYKRLQSQFYSFLSQESLKVHVCTVLVCVVYTCGDLYLTGVPGHKP